jgi:hypothetical protein
MVTITHPKRLAEGRLRGEIKRENESQAAKNNNSRLSPQDRKWRDKVVKLAGGKCKECGSTVRLHAHHTVSVSQAPKLRYVLDNGECLCIKCHAKRHPEISSFLLSSPVASRSDMAKIFARKRQARNISPPVDPDNTFIEIT